MECGDELYCPLIDFIDELSDYGYDFDVKRDGNDVTITEKSGKETFTEAKISIDSPVVLVDGVEYNSDNNALLSGGRIWVDAKAIELIFGATPIYATVYLDNKNWFYAGFNRQSPQCHHSQEEIDSWYESDYQDDYCEHTQRVWLDNGRLYQGKGYFILRDVVWNLFGYSDYTDDVQDYSLTCDNGVVTLIDLYGKEGFNKVVMTNGSNEINIDGNIFYAESPMEIKDGTTYVDFSVLNAIFGVDIGAQKLNYNAGYFDEELGIAFPSWFAYEAMLVRKSPICPHEGITDDWF